MPLDPYKYYTPTSKLYVSWDPINQAHTSGGGIQTNYIGNKGYVSGGQVSTRNVVIGYTVTIRYDGPANIGDRMISQQQVPNYWSDPNVIAQAMGATGISPYDECCRIGYSSTCTDVCYTTTLLCCLCGGFLCCCCVQSCRNSGIEANKISFNTSLDNYANDKMARTIAGMLQHADSSVADRLKHAEEQFKQQQQIQLQVAQQQQFQLQMHQQFIPQRLAGMSANDPQFVGSPAIIRRFVRTPFPANDPRFIDPQQYQQFAQFRQFQQMQSQGQAQAHTGGAQVQLQSQPQPQPQSQIEGASKVPAASAPTASAMASAASLAPTSALAAPPAAAASANASTAAPVAFSKAFSAGPTGALVSFAVAEASNDGKKPVSKPVDRT